MSQQYKSFTDAKNALIKTIDPTKVKLKVEKLYKAEGNAVRIKVKTVDIADKMKQLLNEANVGIEIKNSSKFNPRIVVFGVSRKKSAKQILSDFTHSNLNEEQNEDVKVVYIFPPSKDKSTTRVVMEISSKCVLT